MKKIKIFIRFILLFAIVLTSCEKEHFNTNDSENQENYIVKSGEGLIVLGNRLEDPYALENMNKAYENLKSTKSGTPDVKIKPTHKYIRFLPSDEKEWDILKSDTTLILYDYPLDYEIENMGTYYHDPSLPESSITWQYCVVPLKYKIPNIQNELIYKVYIPDDDSKYSSGYEQFLIDIEYESTKLTGNLPKNTNSKVGAKGLWTKWTPKGTIKTWDNIIGSTTTYTKVFSHYECYDCTTGEPVSCPEELNPLARIVAPIDDNICTRAVYNYIPHTTDGMYIPLNQVSVHARWFTNIKTDLTDENGYFETGQFRNKVNYAIKWERGDYDIRNGTLLQAWYNGPKKKGDWNLKIGTGGESIMYATMHRAAYKHFYGDNLGIRRPTGMGKTKLCYIDEDGSGIFWGDWIDVGILPDIKIWGKKDGSYRTVNQIFGTTTHELGHMSHWHLIGVDNFAFTLIEIYESWADAVEWALTNDEYHKMGDRFGGNAAITYDCEWTNQVDWPLHGGGIEYTPIFIDLMDDINQRVDIHSGSTSFPNDLVEGFTLQYIQDEILKDARGISSLHTAVKANKIAGVSDSDIDELFAIYWLNF